MNYIYIDFRRKRNCWNLKINFYENRKTEMKISLDIYLSLLALKFLNDIHLNFCKFEENKNETRGKKWFPYEYKKNWWKLKIKEKKSLNSVKILNLSKIYWFLNLFYKIMQHYHVGTSLTAIYVIQFIFFTSDFQQIWSE